MTQDKFTTIKESSDELNPTLVVPATVAPKKVTRSAKDYLALAIATCGVGYLPIAPGTWGSLVGVGVYLAVRGALMTFLFDNALEFRLNLFHLYYTIVACEIFVLLLICWLGVWAANRTEALVGRKDPGVVVVDEVAGQFIALLPVPFVIEQAWWSAIVAFFLFRLFDIIKPYPARRLESLPGGMGIMADDLIAGVYAAVCVALLVSLRWLI